MTQHHHPQPPQFNASLPMIDIDLIRADGGTQSRVALDKGVVAEYCVALLAGTEFPPVTLFFDGTDNWLADGFHRVAGAQAAGRTTICAIITPGSRRDALLHGLGANATHGLRRTNADKRKAVLTALNDAEWSQLPHKDIAAICKVSREYVSRVASEIESSCDRSQDTKRTVTRNGKAYTQDTSKIGKAVAAPAPAPKTAPTDAPGTHESNAALRALFSLPPIRESSSTELTIPTMPPQTAVTGDDEVDAVLWLQAVVDTGSQSLIDKALEAAKRIKTPMKELGDRYADHIMRNGGHTIQAVFATMSFGELERRAKGAIAKAARRHEALSRFGTMEALFADTPAETACKAALDGMKPLASLHYQFDSAKAAKRFDAKEDLAPATLADCLHQRAYRHDLYWMRHTVGDFGDGDPAGQAHDDYCFAALARIPPRDTAEALAVLNYLEVDDRLDREETVAILRNLVSGRRE